MKIEKLKIIDEEYSIIRQIYEDRVIVITPYLISSFIHNSNMFLLSNNSCIWTKNVLPCFFGKTVDSCLNRAYLVEIKAKDFKRVKTYKNSFRNFDIKKEITCYEDLLHLAEYQQFNNIVLKFDDEEDDTIEISKNTKLAKMLEMHYFDVENKD